MWPRTDLLELLGIQHPLIQAPMTSSTTPELASAVSNAGALGSLGCGILPPAATREQIERTRQASNRPFNVNLFAHTQAPLDAGAVEAARSRLQPYYDELDLGPVPQASDLIGTFDQARLELMLELRAPVVSFHFGLPDDGAVRRLKDAGCIIISSATTVGEARWLESHGADAIIAQGVEAGGHRGTFTSHPGAGTVGTLSLVPQVADAVRVPVIASGGIFDGRGIAAAFKLGASGVQLGTAFLGCPECNVPPQYRAALRASADEDTQVTRAFTGRPARVLRNRFSTEMQADGEAAALAFPLQVSLTLPLARSADGTTLHSDFFAMYAGQSARNTRELPAAELVGKLVAEAQALL